MVRPIRLTILLPLMCMAFSACGKKGGDQVASSAGSPTASYGQLNDTGIILCADEQASDLECPQGLFPGQDADIGRDALAKQGALTKTGGGIAGFDWVKLDANGQALAIQNQSWIDDGSETDGTHWSCIEDKVTGLIWEVKESDSNHARYGMHTYNWYSNDPLTNGGVAGEVKLDNETCPTSPCNTQNYTAWVNQSKLCGFADWRMPSVRELVSIAVYSKVTPALDQDYFPNAKQPRFFTKHSLASDPNLAWYVYFSDASVSSTNKSDRSYVRLVRGGR